MILLSETSKMKGCEKVFSFRIFFWMSAKRKQNEFWKTLEGSLSMLESKYWKL